jgi:hypothetical protein
MIAKEEIMTNEYHIADVYLSLMEACSKCGNKFLVNDTYYSQNVPVIKCPICGKREYVPDDLIKGIHRQLRRISKEQWRQMTEGKSKSAIKRIKIQLGE